MVHMLVATDSSANLEQASELYPMQTTNVDHAHADACTTACARALLAQLSPTTVDVTQCPFCKPYKYSVGALIPRKPFCTCVAHLPCSSFTRLKTCCGLTPAAMRRSSSLSFASRAASPVPNCVYAQSKQTSRLEHWSNTCRSHHIWGQEAKVAICVHDAALHTQGGIVGFQSVNAFQS